MAIHNPISEDLDRHKASLPPIELPPTNPIQLSKYVLGRRDYFLTSCQPEKQEISIDPDEIVEK